MIVYCRIHCLLGMTIMSVHSNVLMSICSQLKFLLHSVMFQRLSFGSSSNNNNNNNNVLFQARAHIYIHTSKKNKYTYMMNNSGTCSEKNIYKYTYMTCSKNIYKISQDKKYICVKVQTS